jgi:hypothetical protein
LHIRTVDNVGAGSITTGYGVYIQDQNEAATNYAIYSGAGTISFGDDLTFRQSATISTTSGDLRLEPAGDIGIGAAADSTYKLWVEGTIGGQFLRLVSTAPQMRWYDTDGSDPLDYFYMIYNSELVNFWWRDDSLSSWVKFFDFDPAGTIDVHQDLAFQQASTISNTTGNMTIDSAGLIYLQPTNDVVIAPNTGQVADLFLDSDLSASQYARLQMRGHNSVSANITYTYLTGRVLDNTSGNEDGGLEIYAYAAGNSERALRIAGGWSAATYFSIYNHQSTATDNIGQFRFFGRDSGATYTEYARMTATINDPTDTEEDGELHLQVAVAASIVTKLSIIPSEIQFYDDLAFQQASTISTTAGDLTLAPASQVLFPDGSVNSPSISFTSDTNSGMYWTAADRYGFAAQGTGIMEVRYDATYRHVRIKGGDWAGGSINTSTLYMTVGSQSASHLIDETNGVYAIESWLSGTGNDYPIVLNYFGGDVAIGGINNPDGKLHVHDATAGSVIANANANTIVAEATTSGGISILTGNAGAARLWHGTPADDDYHGLDMFGSTHVSKAGIMGLVVAGARRVEFTTTEMQFQQASTISTTTGDLDISPAGSVDMHPGSDGALITATTDAMPSLLFDTDRDGAFEAVGALQFRGHDSGGANTVYVDIRGVIGSPTAGSERGRIYFYTTDGGTSKLTMFLSGGTTSAATEFRLQSEVSSATPVEIQFYGDDSGGGPSQYAGISAYIVDNTATEEDGRLDFTVTIAGSPTTILQLDDGSTAYQQAQTISTTAGDLMAAPNSGEVLVDDVIKLKEISAAKADDATYGQLWVKDDDPNVLMYTDGDGTDYTVDLTPV